MMSFFSITKKKNNRNPLKAKKRSLRMENLENRELLSVSPVGVDASENVTALVSTENVASSVSVDPTFQAVSLTSQKMGSSSQLRTTSAKLLSTPDLTSSSYDASKLTLKITWTKVSNASSYSVYFKRSDSSNYVCWTTTNLNYTTLNGVSAGVTLNFKVTANPKSTAYRQNSTSFTITTLSAGKLATPTISSASASGTMMTVKWGKVTNAAKYTVYYKQSTASSWSSLSTSSTSLSVSNLSAGSYLVNVQAISTNSKYSSSNASATKTVTIASTAQKLATPTISSASASGTTMTVKWGKVTNAANYTVYYKQSTASNWSSLSTSSTSLSVSNLTAGKTYSVYVVALPSSTKYSTSNASATKTVTIASAVKISNLTGYKITFGRSVYNFGISSTDLSGVASIKFTSTSKATITLSSGKTYTATYSYSSSNQNLTFEYGSSPKNKYSLSLSNVGNGVNGNLTGTFYKNNVKAWDYSFGSYSMKK